MVWIGTFLIGIAVPIFRVELWYFGEPHTYENYVYFHKGYYILYIQLSYIIYYISNLNNII